MLAECDTLLMVGSGFPYTEFLPREGQARGVQIDLLGRMLGLRYPMQVSLGGDSAETLRGLRPLLQSKQDRSGAARDARGESAQPPARILGSAWDDALCADRPVVYEAIVHLDVPTLPPTLTPEHRQNLAQALANADPDADGVRRQLQLEGYPI